MLDCEWLPPYFLFPSCFKEQFQGYSIPMLYISVKVSVSQADANLSFKELPSLLSNYL